MKLPLSWLKDYVDTDITAEKLADKLLFCGFEVEEIIYKGKDIENVVAGVIISIVKHPNADKLIICSIDVGTENPLQIVTGANNIKVGDIVPVALHKSLLPNGMKIKEGKLRGVLSQGMLCSGEELCIDDTDYEGASVNGILIIKENVKAGTDIKKVLGLDEYILDVSITANRPDCQSVYGISREVAALLNKPLKPLNLAYKQDDNDNVQNYINTQVESPKLCPRYMAKCVKDIIIKPSPDWMQKRLRLCGIRPINSIVDITNYILLETGQPMHAFDKRFLKGDKIIVRNAKQSEKITTLNEKENILSEDMLVICDAEKPVAVAGIMGGENSGIKDDTNIVIFEAAKFARDSIRKTSRKLSLFSDSSSRFEKGIDANLCEISLDRAMALIYETDCGKIIKGVKDINAEEITQKTLTATKKQIDGVLGIDIDKDTMLKILNNLEIKSEFKGDILTCELPPFREDIEDYPDLAEEIIRFYGYDHLESNLLKNAAITKGGKNENHKNVDRLKDVMTAQGFNEILTYSFINQNSFDKLLLSSNNALRNTIKLKNPLSEQMAVMRTTLIDSMLESVAANTKKKILQGRFFELSNVYIAKSLPLSELPEEKQVLCISCFGNKEDFFSLKGFVENIANSFGVNIIVKRSSYEYMHPGRCADIVCEGTKIGYMGEIHPDVLENFNIKQKVYIAEIDYDIFKNHICFYKGFKAVPKFPEVDRDLALVVKEDITCGELTETIQNSGGRLLKDVKLFDYYKGGQIEKGFVSMAFSLTFGDDSKTLTIEEVDNAINKILKVLQKNYNAVLR